MIIVSRSIISSVGSIIAGICKKLNVLHNSLLMISVLLGYAEINTSINRFFTASGNFSSVLININSIALIKSICCDSGSVIQLISSNVSSDRNLSTSVPCLAMDIASAIVFKGDLLLYISFFQRPYS